MLGSANATKNLCIDANGTEYPLDKKSGIANNPRYIIEYLGKLLRVELPTVLLPKHGVRMPIPKSFFSLTLPANNIMNTTSTKQLGFTLVEMMIAVAHLSHPERHCHSLLQPLY